MPSLLDQPHHDGSALYVDNPDPELGQTVTLRVRVPAAYPVRGVYVRSVYDSEPRVVAAAIERAGEHEQWWRADLLVHNPVTRYRFLLDRVDGGYAWLTARGLADRDVTDDQDFRLTTYPPPPAWAADAVVYEVFPDRFARSGSNAQLPDWAIGKDWYDDPVEYVDPAAVNHVYGGDLRGIEEHLDHIEELGCNTIYLRPFFEAPSNHRYNASTFDEVDPLLGGDEALSSLTKNLHERGLRILGDLTTNHTGDQHPWFRKALADPTSAEAGMYYWRDHPDYVAWYDVSTLPKLNWSSRELYARMTDGPDSVAGKWLREPYSLDGWRIDVANMTGRHSADDFNADVAHALRRTMTQVSPEALLVVEHGYDHTPDVTGDGWYATMNYAGFLRPLWQWLADPDTPVADFIGLPVRIPSRGAEQMVATMREFASRVSWQVLSTNFNLIDSHDTARLRTVCCDPARQLVGAGIMFTFPGIPMVSAGDEIGMQGVTGEDSRRPFPWLREQSWDKRIFHAYRELAALRAAHPALRRGGLRWAHADQEGIAYLRETAGERLLVSACRSGTTRLVLPNNGLNATELTPLYGPETATVAGGSVTLQRRQAGVTVWAVR